MQERTPLDERFWSKVDFSGPCWEWTAGKSDTGYGSFRLWWDGKRRAMNAHRLAYLDLVGDIAPGLQLDHLCRNRACVNPDHLEPVTQLVNIRRGGSGPVVRARAGFCINGHEWAPENIYYRPDNGMRQCRACVRERKQAKAAA